MSALCAKRRHPRRQFYLSHPLKVGNISWHLYERGCRHGSRLVRLAACGDVRAFVELTKRFQHFAFGSALARIHDFEDVVQESFLAAWSALPLMCPDIAYSQTFQSFHARKSYGIAAYPCSD